MTKRLSRFFFKRMHPAVYQGRNRQRPYFEGWYFKLISASPGAAWAVIPGLYRDSDPRLDQAFVMVFDGRSNEVTYHPYDIAAFAAARDTFHVRIGPNLFAADFLTLNLPNLHGHLSFSDLSPWPVSWRAPGIMGWYAWFPMECYHGVVSMDHRLSGRLTNGQESIDFSGGRGYIEKDWGRNFPQTWIWLQANLFAQPGVSLTASIARIPFYGRVFPGFIIGLQVGPRLYRFATYLGSTLERVTINGRQVEIVVRQDQYELRISAEQGRTALLPAPTPGRGMVPRVHESVSALVRVTLNNGSGSPIFSGESTSAGMEIEGDTSILLAG